MPDASAVLTGFKCIFILPLRFTVATSVGRLDLIICQSRLMLGGDWCYMRNVARVASEGTRLSENRQTIKQGGGQEGAFEKEREAI